MDDIVAAIEREVAHADSFSAACTRTVTLLRSMVAHFNWVGIYLKRGNDLVLTAWDGPQATQHVRIPIGQGICGLAARTGETVIVDDVTADPRYLACFPETRAEIVVPIFGQSGVIGEIDIDSDTHAAFTAADQALLERVAQLLGQRENADRE